MYVAVGERVVPLREVVAILDARLVAASETNREFVRRAAAAERLPGGLPPGCRTLVVTPTTVIPTTVATGTLASRILKPRRRA